MARVPIFIRPNDTSLSKTVCVCVRWLFEKKKREFITVRPYWVFGFWHFFSFNLQSTKTYFITLNDFEYPLLYLCDSAPVCEQCKMVLELVAYLLLLLFVVHFAQRIKYFKINSTFSRSREVVTLIQSRSNTYSICSLHSTVFEPVLFSIHPYIVISLLLA